MHGSLGPSAALAHWDGERLDVASHTQGAFVLRDALALALGLEPSAIRVRHVIGPGCYGHNGADDVALDAALLAMAVPGRPVLVKWSREDEHRWEPYGPPAVVELRARLDGSGRISDWRHDAWGTTHRSRPMSGGAANLLAGAELEAPVPSAATHAVPRDRGRDPPQRDADLRPSAHPDRQALRRQGAAADLVAAQPRRLRQRAGDRVVHGRARARRRRHARAVPPEAPERRARPRGAPGGGGAAAWDGEPGRGAASVSPATRTRRRMPPSSWRWPSMTRAPGSHSSGSASPRTAARSSTPAARRASSRAARCSRRAGR